MAAQAADRIDAGRQPTRVGVLQMGTFGLLFLLGSGLIVLGVLLDTSIGIVDLSVAEVWRALTVDDTSQTRAIVWELRLPRALVAGIIGLNLAIAGVIMQAVTRNPLASPSLTGVSAGAGLFVVASFVLWPGRPFGLTPIIAFAGGLAGGTVVFSLALRSIVTPTRLALAGIATATLLLALTTGLLLLNSQTVGTVYFWLAGGVAGRGWHHVWLVVPWTVGGTAVALLLARQLNILMLGEDVAKSLGIATGRTRAILMITSVMLTGSAVAVAGPVGFVGLISPHVARYLIGPDHRLLIPLAAAFGGALVVWADIAARNIQRPLEIPVGILIAMLGGPFFLYLARRSA